MQNVKCQLTELIIENHSKISFKVLWDKIKTDNQIKIILLTLKLANFQY